MKMQAKILSEIQKAGSAIASAQSLISVEVTDLAKQASSALASGSGELATQAVGQWNGLLSLNHVVKKIESELFSIYTILAKLNVATTSPAAPNKALPKLTTMPAKQVRGKRGRPPSLSKPLASTPLTVAQVISQIAEAKPDAKPASPAVAVQKSAKPKPAKKRKAVSVKKASKPVVAASVPTITVTEAPVAAPAVLAPSATPAEALPLTTQPALAPRVRVSKKLKVQKTKAALVNASGNAKPSRISQLLAKSKIVRRTIPKGNAGKLMQYLVTKLNTQEFQVVTHSDVSKATGIAIGSINAALKKAVEVGALVVENGNYKLPAPV